MKAKRKKRTLRRGEQSYYHEATKPLTSLAFVLPWIVLFELGALWLSGKGEFESEHHPLAYFILNWLMNLIGVSGYYHPGLIAVAVLLVWHLKSKQPWKLRPVTLLAMMGESMILALPLLIFARVIQAATSRPVETWFANLVLSIGAGIYEELLFRLILIGLLTLAVIDLARIERSAGLVAVVLISAAVFAGAHHPPMGDEPFTLLRFLFRTGAGIYLAGVYVLRGFGLAVGCHACYDVIVVTWNAVRG
jgi:hypothetical protein